MAKDRRQRRKAIMVRMPARSTPDQASLRSLAWRMIARSITRLSPPAGQIWRWRLMTVCSSTNITQALGISSNADRENDFAHVFDQRRHSC